MGRKKLNKNENETIKFESKDSSQQIVPIQINTLKELPQHCQVRGFALSFEDSVDSSFCKYENIYGHKPKEAWVYKNSKYKILYLKLEKEDK